MIPMKSFVYCVLLGCATTTSPTVSQTAQWHPIHGDSRVINAPSSYKGLPLRLTDNGEPDVLIGDGTIGVVCIGMSNAAQECERYILAAQTVFAGEVNPDVRIVNCALASHAIERWNDPEYDSALWTRCSSLISAAGLTLSEIHVVLHKAANQYTLGPNQEVLPLYPDPSSDYFSFGRNLSTFADRVTTFFPELRAVYTTSRSYGGFSNRPERGEPLSYEEGHALNQWLLENSSVNGVWFGWGPYIWAPECSTGIKNGLGYCYDRQDYSQDAIHPTSLGEVKVAKMWHARLSQHAWYTR
jgi:hypothetical protein